MFSLTLFVHRSHPHRIFFVCVFVLVFGISVSFIRIIWTQWTTSTIVTFDSHQTVMTYVPFPAITICNTNLVKSSAVQKLANDSQAFSIVKDLCEIEARPPYTMAKAKTVQQVMWNVSVCWCLFVLHVDSSPATIQLILAD